MQELFITIVGFSNYYGKEPFRIGAELICVKEPDNAFDSEAIKATIPLIGTVGYVANGVTTKANGTFTAGRVYDRVGDRFMVRVLFTTNTKVIARIESGAADASQTAGGPTARLRRLQGTGRRRFQFAAPRRIFRRRL